MENPNTTATAYDLIFDVSNMFHRSFSIYNKQIPNFSLDNIDHSNMLVRKFVVDFCSIAKIINTSNLFFCFDDISFRKKVDVGYKASRSVKTASFYETMDKIYNLLEFKGLNAVKVKGLEADDCIALICEKNEHIPKIIISSDDDVKQLVRTRTYVLTPHVSQRALYRCLYSIHPPQIGETPINTIHAHYILGEKILKGCKGDEVPSVAPKGFRTKSIEKIADDYMRQKMNHNDTVFNSWRHALNLSELEVTDERLLLQLQLVCLQSQFMPQESVELFNQLKFTQMRITDFTVESICRNTVYWREDYKQK